MTSWKAWRTYFKRPDKLIMSPHHWGWWQCYNLRRQAPLHEKHAWLLFNLNSHEPDQPLFPSPELVARFEVMEPHLQAPI